ncbi:MAG: TIGR04255 family protein [Phycisphaerales bacterium]|nr:TIGR04255 family protein [Phycisphaerales bacterium]
MTNWPTLRNAPIVEGLIDVRTRKSPVVTVDVLRACADSLAAEFPRREEIRQFASEVSLSSEGGASVSAQAPAPVGVMLRSADGQWVAQFSLDGFTVSRLVPYTSWDDLRSCARRLWGCYRAAAQPERVTRIAARYINRIVLGPDETPERVFATTFCIADRLPQTVAGFLLRLVIPFENGASAIVTEALSENSDECILDIDAFVVSPAGIEEDEAWSRIEDLRSIKNRLFFESLTPEALRRFE